MYATGRARRDERKKEKVKLVRLGTAKYFYINESVSHHIIAQIFIAYLLQFNQPDSITAQNIVFSPLALHAAKEFTFHVQSICSGSVDGTLKRLLHRLFEPKITHELLSWERLNRSYKREGHIELADKIDLKEAASPLWYATSSGLTQIVQHLIDSGCNVNVKNKDESALYVSADKGRTEIVKLLLENGADINATGGRYGTALQAVCYEGRIELCKLLLENGADASIVAGKYGTALQAASCWDYAKIVKLLLENSTDPNIVGGQYGTTLQAAASMGHTEMVKLLLKNGADANVVGEQEAPPLQTACNRGHIETVRLLLASGANANFIWREKITPLLMALNWGHVEIIKLLLSAGANTSNLGEYRTIARAKSVEDHTEILILLRRSGADFTL